MNNKCFPDIEKLWLGQPCDKAQILEILDFIDKRYDCADFRMVCILRSLFDFSSLISPETLRLMKKTVLGFRYWMDEPGEDSMCFWSENHQLLFATCEYLAGQLYPYEVFSNSGLTGAQHLQKARPKISSWLKTRFELGFVEWHSNTYYEEDIATLSLLIDCCKDELLVTQCNILLDLLLLDLALHSFKGLFCATSGRCYENQKKDPFKQDVLDITEKAFGFGNKTEYDFTRLSSDFIINRRYKMPKVIYEIAHNHEDNIIKDSMGLDLSELDSYFPNKHDINGRGMFLWSMEAFTNSESVNQTIKIFNDWKLRTNDFLKNISVLNIPVVKQLGLLPQLVKILNPITQGIAIQRANTYTYKTNSFMLSTAQGYHPGEFGDQQHIWQATLAGGVSVFTTHPGATFFEDNARNFSPSYWVGNGVLPHAGQYKNVTVCMYDLRVRKGLLEKERLQLTHAYFPFGKLDEFRLCDRMVFGRKGDAYVALFGLREFRRLNNDELIQDGAVTAWACALGSQDFDGSFQHFIYKNENNSLALNGSALTFTGGEHSYCLHYKKHFSVNRKIQRPDYHRLDCRFVKAQRLPKEYNISHNGLGLYLNFSAIERRVEE